MLPTKADIEAYEAWRKKRDHDPMGCVADLVVMLVGAAVALLAVWIWGH